MERQELDTILAEHAKWRLGDGGKRADLSGANLSHANLYGADLSGANLSGADLYDADLSGANLSDTCLAPNLHDLARAFARACPADPDGRRIVYRTAQSQHIGSAIYEPGKTYDAPYLSWDVATACHPGIYAASLRWMRENYPYTPLVKCYVYDGDWTITAKGAIRTAHLEVIAYVED